MSATTMQQASVLTGRQMVLFLVVGLHALVIGALMTMRFKVDVPPVPAFKPVTRIELVQPPAPPKPVVPVATFTPTVVVPVVPAPVIQLPLESTINVPPAQPTPQGVTESTGGDAFVIPPTELVSRATRSPDDYYPSASITMQEEGASVVRVCVGPTGRLEGRPTIQTSSRSRRLDEAAIRWASEALEFTPATRNGSAVSACKDYRVVFNLR